MGHNGTLVGAKETIEALISSGEVFESDSDSELILHYLARSQKSNLVDALIEALEKIRGAYSLIVMNEKQLIAARDPYGFRPLSLATFDYGNLVSSESNAFKAIDEKLGVHYLREIDPGEIIILEPGKDPVSVKPFGRTPLHRCIFELIYFAHPASYLFGHDVFKFRMQLGQAHALEHRISVDCIVPIPDSARYFTIGHSLALGVPVHEAFVRSHYIPRTFIDADKKHRENNVRLKLTPIDALLKGFDISLDDDSIVRGPTIRKNVQTVRRGGAKSVTVSISCSPLINRCPYGIDIKEQDELIAPGNTIGEICSAIGADDLRYLSLESMHSVAGIGFCDGCFTGNYPVT